MSEILFVSTVFVKAFIPLTYVHLDKVAQAS